MTDTEDTQLVRPTRPDNEIVSAQTKQLTAAIEKYAARIQEIKDNIADKRSKKEQPSQEERSLIKSLHDTRSHFQSALQQKQTIRNQLNDANKARENLKTKVKQIKENSSISSVEEIDKEIKRLEDKVNKTELTKKEEDDCVAQIRQLARSREKVKIIRNQLEEMGSDENLVDDLMEKLKEIDADLDRSKAKEKDLQHTLDQLRKKREEEESDINTLNAEKQECYEILCALRQKKKEINGEFTERMDKFREEEKEYKAKRRELERKKRQEERAKIEEEKVEEKTETAETKDAAPAVRQYPRRKKQFVPSTRPKQKKIDDKERQKAIRRQKQYNQYLQEQQHKISACNFLLNYLSVHGRSLKQATEEEEDSKEVSGRPQMEGMKVLKKEDVESDAWLFGNKTKKTKSKKKRSAKPEKAEDKKLGHSLQTFQAFSELNVPPPDTLSDVPRTIEVLEKLKTDIQSQKFEPESSDKEEEEKALDETVEPAETKIEEAWSPVLQSSSEQPNTPATVENEDPEEELAANRLTTYTVLEKSVDDCTHSGDSISDEAPIEDASQTFTVVDKPDDVFSPVAEAENAEKISDQPKDQLPASLEDIDPLDSVEKTANPNFPMLKRSPLISVEADHVSCEFTVNGDRVDVEFQIN